MFTKADTPFHSDGHVYFELNSPQLAVLESSGDPVVFSVPDFEPGIYRIHVDAIVPGLEGSQQGSISVDGSQLFFVDAGVLEDFLEAFDFGQGAWPNYDYFGQLRAAIGNAFGYLVVGGEPAEHFDGDGVYSLNLSMLQYPGRFVEPAMEEAHELDLYIKVAKSMKTYVCTDCFKDEFQIGPGNKASYKEAAEEAIELGWRITSERSDFGDFAVHCPSCVEGKRQSQ